MNPAQQLPAPIDPHVERELTPLDPPGGPETYGWLRGRAEDHWCCCNKRCLKHGGRLLSASNWATHKKDLVKELDDGVQSYEAKPWFKIGNAVRKRGSEAPAVAVDASASTSDLTSQPKKKRKKKKAKAKVGHGQHGQGGSNVGTVIAGPSYIDVLSDHDTPIWDAVGEELRPVPPSLVASLGDVTLTGIMHELHETYPNGYIAPDDRSASGGIPGTSAGSRDHLSFEVKEELIEAYAVSTRYQSNPPPRTARARRQHPTPPSPPRAQPDRSPSRPSGSPLRPSPNLPVALHLPLECSALVAQSRKRRRRRRRSQSQTRVRRSGLRRLSLGDMRLTSTTCHRDGARGDCAATKNTYEAEGLVASPTLPDEDDWTEEAQPTRPDVDEVEAFETVGLRGMVGGGQSEDPIGGPGAQTPSTPPRSGSPARSSPPIIFNTPLGASPAHQSRSPAGSEASVASPPRPPRSANRPSPTPLRPARDPRRSPPPPLASWADLSRPTREDLKNDFEFMESVNDATLDNALLGKEDKELLKDSLLNPPDGGSAIDPPSPSALQCIRIWIAFRHQSQFVYTKTCEFIREKDPNFEPLSLYSVKKLVEDLTHVNHFQNDMCINGCLAFTGPFAKLDRCPHTYIEKYTDRDSKGKPRQRTRKKLCDEARWVEEPGQTNVWVLKGKLKERIPRKRFYWTPLGPQLQARFRNRISAEHMRRAARDIKAQVQAREAREAVLVAEGKDPDDARYRTQSDFSSGEAMYHKYIRKEICEDDDILDIFLMLSADGTQLYPNRKSDSWLAAFTSFNPPRSDRYKTSHTFPALFIPGPNKPKHMNSFLFPAIHHLRALMRKDGLKAWDASQDRIITLRPQLLFLAADGPGLKELNGAVGHFGARGCRLMCDYEGVWAGRYVQALRKPGAEDKTGQATAMGIAEWAADSHAHLDAVERLLKATTQEEQDTQQKLTGVAHPSLFLGLPETHTLGMPGMLTVDMMHIPALNMPDLMIKLWRGIVVSSAKEKRRFPWEIFAGDDGQLKWEKHGALVEACRHFLPNFFGRHPRDIAKKGNSGYKAWEFLSYFFMLGPGLYGIDDLLPPKFYENYCRLVKAMRIHQQSTITPEEAQEALEHIVNFCVEFEHLYVGKGETGEVVPETTETAVDDASKGEGGEEAGGKGGEQGGDGVGEVSDGEGDGNVGGRQGVGRVAEADDAGDDEGGGNGEPEPEGDGVEPASAGLGNPPDRQRLHFIRPWLHTILHLHAQLVTNGPTTYYTQWTLENLIGFIKKDLRLHTIDGSAQNIANIELHLAQMNALNGIDPTLFPQKPKSQYAKSLGKGYALLQPHRKSYPPTPAELDSIERHASKHFADRASRRWAKSTSGVFMSGKLCLPGGITARSIEGEKVQPGKKARRVARMVEFNHTSETRLVETRIAEVRYYCRLHERAGREQVLAVGTMFTRHDKVEYRRSHGTVRYCQAGDEEAGIVVFPVTAIRQVVGMVPLFRQGWWYVCEKPRGGKSFEEFEQEVEGEPGDDNDNGEEADDEGDD